VFHSPEGFSGEVADDLAVLVLDGGVDHRAGDRPPVADVAFLDLALLAAHPVLPARAVLADAVEEDAVVADCVEARLPLARAPPVLRAEVEILEGLERGQAAEDLAGDVQHRFAVDEFDGEHVEGVAVEAEDRVLLRGGAADVARDLVGPMGHAQPLLPLREPGVEERGEDGGFGGAERRAKQAEGQEAHGREA
jgi:hypothetical protein